MYSFSGHDESKNSNTECVPRSDAVAFENNGKGNYLYKSNNYVKTFCSFIHSVVPNAKTLQFTFSMHLYILATPCMPCLMVLFLFVFADFKISCIKMPPKMLKRGRPKGAGLTIIGIPRKSGSSKKPVSFVKKSGFEKAKSKFILLQLISFSINSF